MSRYHSTTYADDVRPRAARSATGRRFGEFVRTRRAEHWWMFAAGFVIGAILL